MFSVAKIYPVTLGFKMKPNSFIVGCLVSLINNKSINKLLYFYFRNFCCGSKAQ